MRNICLVTVIVAVVVLTAGRAALPSPPTSQPAKPPFEPIDGAIDSYRALPAPEEELTGKLWGRRAAAVSPGTPIRAYGSDAAGEGDPGPWHLMLIHDGRRTALATDSSALTRLVGKQITVRGRLTGKKEFEDATFAVGWFRAEPEPAEPPPGRQSGWLPIEGEDGRYARLIAGEVSLRGKLETAKVNGIA
ncbi:MAG: hypothetical protein PHU85_01910, partial [Phycisphaerae bacterium]|nr:hypothetical protein [Phycisphaerae bacterium]